MAGLAVIVAGIGLHHTLAYTVDARRREIAVRIAVGGTPGRVSAEILRSSIALALLAAVAGTIASAAFTPLLTTQARGVPTDDAATYLIVGVVLFVASAGVAALSVVACGANQSCRIAPIGLESVPVLAGPALPLTSHRSRDIPMRCRGETDWCRDGWMCFKARWT